ncbi:MAG: hypothetical protein H0X26_01275 [Alphaproteobacteria bacterium]|nr:hypothetical protein [Alphaproteobacteria bacterium]
MRKYLILLACTAILGQEAQAQEYLGNQTLKGETLHEVNIMGSANLTDIKADTLSVLGTLEFHNLAVTKETNIAGPIKKSEKGKFGSLNIVGEFEAADVTCTKLDAAGSVSVAGLTVSGDANIAGSLTLKASKDPNKTSNNLKNLTIAAAEISLEDTIVEGNILVKKTSEWVGGDKKQVLKLLGKTTVKGTISFEAGNGTLEQSGDVKIEGKVTGATVEKK